MESDVLEGAAAVLYAASLAQSVALGVVLGLRNSATARVGDVWHRARASQRRRVLGLAGLGLLAVLAACVPGVPLTPALVLLVLSAAMVALTPSIGDTAVGAAGARAGWRAARFAEMEEWRLTGEHLRWRQRGEWLASRTPPERQADLRAVLERLAPDRESRFQH